VYLKCQSAKTQALHVLVRVTHSPCHVAIACLGLSPTFVLYKEACILSRDIHTHVVEQDVLPKSRKAAKDGSMWTAGRPMPCCTPFSTANPPVYPTGILLELQRVCAQQYLSKSAVYGDPSCNTGSSRFLLILSMSLIAHVSKHTCGRQTPSQGAFQSIEAREQAV